VTVGSGGDFTSINAALEMLSRTVINYKNNGFVYEIVLLSGFVIRESIYVRGVDLSGITIKAQASVVTVDRGDLVASAPAGLPVAFLYVTDGGASPIIDFKFTLSSGAGNQYGVYATGAKSVAALKDTTINGFYRSAVAVESGEIEFQGATELGGSGCVTAMVITGGSVTVSGDLTMDDCSSYTTSMGGGILRVGGDMTVRYNNSFAISANSSAQITISGNYNSGNYNGGTGGDVKINTASRMTVGGSMSARSSTSPAIFVNASSRLSVALAIIVSNSDQGLVLELGSTVSCGSVNAAFTAGARGIGLFQGSSLSVAGALNTDNTFSAANVGLEVSNSIVFCASLIASGVSNGVRAWGGSRISVNGDYSAWTGSTQADQTADTNVLGGSIISCDKFWSGSNIPNNSFRSEGIIWG
jgi:hypothetical protein